MAEAAGLVLWVLQDRKRFDSTIEQLDFLLSNLEKISEAPKRRHGMAHKDEPEHYRYHQTPDVPEDNGSALGTEDNPDQEDLYRRFDRPQGQPTQGSPTSHIQPGPPQVNFAARPTRTMPEFLASETGGEQRGAHVVRGRIADNTVRDDGIQLAGQTGAVSNVANPVRDIVSNSAGERSTQVLGIHSEGALERLADIKKAGARKEEADS